MPNCESHHQQASPLIILNPSEFSSHNPINSAALSMFDLSPQELQNLLDRYINLMAPSMPFVLLPPLPVTVGSFDKLPYLLRAIVTVAHFHDTSVQQLLLTGLIRQITEAIFVTGGKSLDLLQCLLVLGTWYNPHLSPTPSSTTILHLCMALTTDLAIDRDPVGCEVVQISAAMKNCGIPQPVKVVSDEERRAVLGVFYQASVIFTSYRKTDCPTWTPWLQTCLDVLKETGKKSDGLLVSLVSSQRLMHQTMSTSTCPYNPAALQNELDSQNTTDECVAEGVTQTLLRLQRACTRIAIHESSLSISNLQGMWSCVHAISSYLAIYNSLPVSLYLTIPFTVFAQFAYVFVVMVRASSTNISGLDGKLLREFVNFEEVMEEASAKYEAVGRLCVDGVKVKNEGFESWAKKTRWAKVFYGMQARDYESRRASQMVTEPSVGASMTVDLSFDDGLLGESFWVDGGMSQDNGLDFETLDSLLTT